MQQQAAQQAMQKAVQNLMNDMTTLYKHQMQMLNDLPMIVPVVVMPQAAPTPSRPTVATPAPTAPARIIPTPTAPPAPASTPKNNQ